MNPDGTEPPKKPPLRAVPIEKVREARGAKKVAVSRSKVASTRAFRRIRADRAFGIVGVVAIVIAAYLLFNWELPPPEPQPTFSVEWTQVEHEARNETFTLNASQDDTNPQEFAFTFAEPNVTKVNITATWGDDVGDEEGEYDVISFEMLPPASANLTLILRSQSSTQTPQAHSLESVVVPVPNVRDVAATTMEEAVAAFGNQTSYNGTGPWTLRIWFNSVNGDYASNDTRGRPCPAEIPNVCRPDTGNEIHIQVRYWTYRSELLPPGSS